MKHKHYPWHTLYSFSPYWACKILCVFWFYSTSASGWWLAFWYVCSYPGGPCILGAALGPLPETLQLPVQFRLWQGAPAAFSQQGKRPLLSRDPSSPWELWVKNAAAYSDGYLPSSLPTGRWGYIVVAVHGLEAKVMYSRMRKSPLLNLLKSYKNDK